MADIKNGVSNSHNTQLKESHSDEIVERIQNLEREMQGLKRNMDDMSMAIELFKTYGFQPKQFDELMRELKASRNIK